MDAEAGPHDGYTSVDWSDELDQYVLVQSSTHECFVLPKGGHWSAVYDEDGFGYTVNDLQPDIEHDMDDQLMMRLYMTRDKRLAILIFDEQGCLGVGVMVYHRVRVVR